MNPNAAAPRVIIRHCDAYDSERIRGHRPRGLRELGLVPHGRTLREAEPRRAGEHVPARVHARPSSARACSARCRTSARDTMTELAVGERCGITIPTRYAFEQSGLRRDARRARRASSATASRRSRRSRSATRTTKRLRDYVFTPEPVAQGRLLRQLPQVQGAPVDDGHLLDEELHRDPGRPAPPHRPRPPAEREDRRPPVHHPAAVHRHRRDHRRRGAHADAQAVRRSNLIIMGNNQVAFDAVCCAIIGVDPRDGRPHPPRGRARLRHDRTCRKIAITRRRHARGGEGAREGLRGRPHPRREVLRGHAHHRVRGAAAGGRAHRLLLGRLPGRHRGGHRDPPPRTTRSATRRCRACTSSSAPTTGPIDAKPGEKVVFIGDCAKWKGKIGDELVQIESLYKDRSTKDPHKAEARRHLRQDRQASPRSSQAQRKAHVRPPRGLPGERRRAGASRSCPWARRKNPYLEPGRGGALQRGVPVVEGGHGRPRDQGPEIPDGGAVPAR